MRRATRAAAIVTLAATAWAASGSLARRTAHHVTPGAHIAAMPPAAIDSVLAPELARFAADQPNTHVLRAIALDIDHDGDLDVVASTADSPVAVWINDGAGHYTRETPATSSRMGAAPDVAPNSSPDARAGLMSTTGWHAAVLDRASFSPIVSACLQLVPVASRPAGPRALYRPTRAPPLSVSI